MGHSTGAKVTQRKRGKERRVCFSAKKKQEGKKVRCKRRIRRYQLKKKKMGGTGGCGTIRRGGSKVEGGRNRQEDAGTAPFGSGEAS